MSESIYRWFSVTESERDGWSVGGGHIKDEQMLRGNTLDADAQTPNTLPHTRVLH